MNDLSPVANQSKVQSEWLAEIPADFSLRPVSYLFTVRTAQSKRTWNKLETKSKWSAKNKRSSTDACTWGGRRPKHLFIRSGRPRWCWARVGRMPRFRSGRNRWQVRRHGAESAHLVLSHSPPNISISTGPTFLRLAIICGPNRFVSPFASPLLIWMRESTRMRLRYVKWKDTLSRQLMQLEWSTSLRNCRSNAPRDEPLHNRWKTRLEKQFHYLSFFSFHCRSSGSIPWKKKYVAGSLAGATKWLKARPVPALADRLDFYDHIGPDGAAEWVGTGGRLGGIIDSALSSASPFTEALSRPIMFDPSVG